MHSHTPDLIPFSSPYNIEVFSDSQLETLKNGTLTLLDEVGVHFPSPQALSIFAQHGARVDTDTQIVRLSPDLVHEAMRSAPRSFTLGGREERFDLLLDGSSSYLCTEGCGVHVIDPDTGRQRPSCKADVALSARVSDALPLIGFYWPMVTSQDRGLTAQLHDCHAGLTSTLKHVRGGTSVHPRLAPYIVEMAAAVAGSRENLRRRPPINANICTISPLAHDQHGIESALIYAAAGIPVSFMAMCTMGSTSPASPLAALIQGDAEVVSAMVLLQLAFPGTPVFHSVLVSLMDPRDASYISDVPLPVGVMSTQLGHAWNVPCLGGGGVDTDAVHNGWQSGVEGGMGSVFIPMAGADVCGHLGLTDGAMIFSPAKLILDHEICRNAYDKLHGFKFDAGALALDVIKRVGPRGHFLMEEHTCERIRDFRLSPIVAQNDEQHQPIDPVEVARREFDRIRSTHQPEPLPQKVLQEMDRILASAGREAEALTIAKKR